MLRGIMVGAVAFLAISAFVPLSFFSVPHAIFYAVFACMFLAFLGLLCGILSSSFDQMSAMTSYIITPLTFLSGTFYSTNSLPEFWKNIAHFNPFFYMIDGFRYSLTGSNDGDLLTGMIFILIVNLILGIVIYHMIKRGYRIKS
mgnify:CR=1 FL=1